MWGWSELRWMIFAGQGGSKRGFVFRLREYVVFGFEDTLDLFMPRDAISMLYIQYSRTNQQIQ